MSSPSWSAEPPSPSALAAASNAASRLLHLRRRLVLGVVQCWLAMFYLGAGYAKITQPHDILSLLMTWPTDVDLAWIKTIGWLELGLALGVAVPMLSLPTLRPALLASAVVLMLNAAFMAGYHAAQKDLLLSGVNVFLLALAVVLFFGRRRQAQARRL